MAILLWALRTAMIAKAVHNESSAGVNAGATRAEVLSRRFIVSQPRHTHLTCFDVFLIRVNNCLWRAKNRISHSFKIDDHWMQIHYFSI